MSKTAKKPTPKAKKPTPKNAPKTVAPVKPKAAPAPTPTPLPEFVKAVSPAERKAIVEALANEEVGQVLKNAPWRRSRPVPPEPKPIEPAEPSVPARPPSVLREKPSAAPEIPTRPVPPPTPVGRSPKRPVLLDSNALMMQFQFHIDIEKELDRILDFAHEIVVPSIVVDELAAIAREGAGKDAGEARMALELAKTFRIVEAPGEGDPGILRVAEKLNAVVVTNDKVLRARLRAKDIANVYMRSRAFLTIEGHVPGT